MKNLAVYKDAPPKVSVITATFNRSHLLGKCIESVISQSYEHWEHIIIDDGSTDDTYDLVKKYMDKDSRIRYVRHKNRKQSLSLNVGLMMAAGEYACFLDSDDYYHMNHITSRLDFFKEHPDICFVHGGLKVVGDPYVIDALNPSKKILIEDCCAGGSFFAPTSIFREIGGFKDIVFGNDRELLKRVKDRFKVKKLVAEKHRTVFYVRTEDSITKNYERLFNSKNQGGGLDKNKAPRQ
jgi:glycosyltransferase involved in cell wall biosynthesis